MNFFCLLHSQIHTVICYVYIIASNVSKKLLSYVTSICTILYMGLQINGHVKITLVSSTSSNSLLEGSKGFDTCIWLNVFRPRAPPLGVVGQKHLGVRGSPP